MIKHLFYISLSLAFLGLLIGAMHLYKVSQKNKKEMKEHSKEVKYSNNLGKVLIIYYSLDGNTKDIANRIREKTGADIYEIKTKDIISKGPKLHISIKKQLSSNKFPEIETNFPNIDSYDTIFFGAPVWWYTIATPALSFLEKFDFKNKKTIPFSTQGSNVGSFFEDFNKKAINIDIKKEEKFNNMPKKYNKNIDNKISKWLNNI